MPPSTDDDRLLPATRVLALVIIPVLVAAFTVLFGFPGRTRQLWAWTIRPDLAALIMGGAYVAGAWFFARGLHVGRWHRVAIGWLAVIPFTALLGVATFVHWDRFNHDHVSFWAWLVLYTATPIALPILWLRNQRAAGPPPDGSGLQLPTLPRVLTGAFGGALLVAAAVIFVRPQTAIGRWPWALTPLTARTLAVVRVLPGRGVAGLRLHPGLGSAGHPLRGLHAGAGHRRGGRAPGPPRPRRRNPHARLRPPPRGRHPRLVGPARLGRPRNGGPYPRG